MTLIIKKGKVTKYRNPKLSKGIKYDDVARIYDMIKQLDKTNVPRTTAIDTIYDMVNKGKRKPRRKRLNPIEEDPGFAAGSPLAKQLHATKEVKRLFGIRGHVLDEWGTCQVGELIKGEFRIYGEGPTFESALEAASKNFKC